MAGRQPRSGNDQSGVSFGDRNRESGGDEGPGTGFECDGLGGPEVEARITGMRACGEG